MAKAIPKAKAKSKVKAKAKVKAKRTDREITAYLNELEAVAQERHDHVVSVMAIQDDSTVAALDSMVESLHKMQGPPRLTMDGQIIAVNEEQFKQLQGIQHWNFEWIALRCLIACAEWGIRIANFKAPKKTCLRCGKRVKK